MPRAPIEMLSVQTKAPDSSTQQETVGGQNGGQNAQATTTARPQNKGKKRDYRFVDPTAQATKVRLAKEKSVVPNIPLYVLKIASDNSFADIDDNEAAKILLQTLQLHRIRGQRATKLFYQMKPLFFPSTVITPNTLAFDTNKAPQLRVPSFDAIERLVQYVHASDTKYRWPILLAFYTGLRSAETCRFQASHLAQLIAHDNTIPLQRKLNSEWHPIYYADFDVFIKQMAEHFSAELTAYRDRGIDVKLFQYTARNLHYYLNKFYVDANHELAVDGFGLHVFRYFVASKLTQNGSTELARQFLGHKKSKTTLRYIKADELRVNDKLREINQHNKLYREILAPNDTGTINDIGELY